MSCKDVLREVWFPIGNGDMERRARKVMKDSKKSVVQGTTQEERSITRECFSCIHKRSIMGDAHIRCANPDEEMTGAVRGIRMGWFVYPRSFDPTWKTKLCSNFEKESAREAYRDKS